jgi:chorismate dehydratase
MKLGYIDYLNCYPFYYHMFEKEPLPGVDVVPAYPSALNRMLAAGELDMSPISSAAYAGMQDDTVVLPDFCLSSVGYVRSVVLVSNLPVEELDGRTVGLTSASQTSVVLLKILLSRYFRVKPRYTESPPMPSLEGLDAALVIGNEAMLDMAEPPRHVYDIGELWLEKTGHPVVFAVFALRKSARESIGETVERVIRSYAASLRCLQSERADLIAKAAAKNPNINPGYIDGYYRLLRFEFSGPLKDALRFYYRAAAEEGLLAEVPDISWHG